ncbi:MAG: hypothetical protein IAF08_13500 [Rhizobacter sp.]|nr:hypothetical protein [Chlorobiales bacterium]
MSRPRTLVLSLKTAPDDFGGANAERSGADTTRSLALRHLALQSGTASELLRSPLTAKIVAIALCDADLGKGKVFYEPAYPDNESLPEAVSMFSDDERTAVQFEPADEVEMLMRFWSASAHYTEFITFGGAIFDHPFILTRSALHRIKPSKLLGKSKDVCIDLSDELSQHRALHLFPLEFYAKRFGLSIGAPLEAVPDAAAVADLYTQGRLHEIAELCWRDAALTAALYKIWREHFRL